MPVVDNPSIEVVVANIFAAEEGSVVVDGVALGADRVVNLERPTFPKVHFAHWDDDWDVGRQLSGEEASDANVGVQVLSSELVAVHRFSMPPVHFQLFLAELFAEVVGDGVADPILKFAVGLETDEAANELGLLCPFQAVEDTHTVVGCLDFLELHFHNALIELVGVVCHKAETNSVAFL